MSPSKILFFLSISFIAGIFLESVIKIPRFFIWGTLVMGALLILLSLFVKKISCVFGFCILFLVLGLLRIQISEFNIANDKLSKFNGKGMVEMTGIISNEPDVRDAYQKMKVKVGESAVLITTNKYPEYKYLDK